MIKVMNLVAILIAPSTVVLADSPVRWIVVVVSLAVLAGAVLFSKRGSIASEDGETQAVQRKASAMTE